MTAGPVATMQAGADNSSPRKGAIREIEVHPGEMAEWWFVPVAAGRVTDVHCGIVGTDGVSHRDHGMIGEIVIE